MTDTTSPRQKQDPAEVIAEAMWMHETDGARWEYAQTNFAPKLRERAANERGGTSAVECVVALGSDSHGYFVIADADGDAAKDALGWVEECKPAAA